MHTESFFHPGIGWTDDPDGATVRLVSNAVARVEADTILYRAGEDGDWRVEPDEATLTALERGLDYAVWSSTLRGRSLRAFRGVCPLAAALTQALLHDLRALDEDGFPLDLSEGQSAPQTFFLNDDDARLFVSRLVDGMGGRVSRGDPASGASQRQLMDELDRLRDRADSERAADAACLALAREGVMTQAADFDARGLPFRALALDAERVTRELRLSVAAFLTAERGRKERAQAAALIEEAGAIVARIQAQREARDRDACELALRVERADGHTPAAPPSALPALAFREVARAAAEAGYAIDEHGDTFHIALPGGQVLALGPGFSVA